jgi:hypothetical protein|tara:strand:+ start:1916 stop:2023 length:108 start_codon:yes stop_codon:yes gene_type:complete
MPNGKIYEKERKKIMATYGRKPKKGGKRTSTRKSY